MLKVILPFEISVLGALLLCKGGDVRLPSFSRFPFLLPFLLCIPSQLLIRLPSLIPIYSHPMSATHQPTFFIPIPQPAPEILLHQPQAAFPLLVLFYLLSFVLFFLNSDIVPLEIHSFTEQLGTHTSLRLELGGYTQSLRGEGLADK